MDEWIKSVLSTEQAGITVLAATFLLGIISVFTCGCNLAVVGTIAGYTGTLGASGRTRTVIISSLFFFLGITVAMSAMGTIIGYAGELISDSMGSYWKIGAGVIAIFFGLYTVDLVPFKVPGISLKYNNERNSVMGAVIFGLAIGGVTSLCGLCCSPFFPVVMAASFVNGDTLWGFFMMLAYSLGYGLTLAAAMAGVGLGLGRLSRSLNKFTKVLKYTSGALLIGLGFYFILTF